jgi:hypothetical protein
MPITFLNLCDLLYHSGLIVWLRKQWTCGELFHPPKNSVICSGHFEENWFDITSQTVCVHDEAVPTVFTRLHRLVKGGMSHCSLAIT